MHRCGRLCTDGEYRGAAGDLARLRNPRLGIGAEIGFVEQDGGLGAALAREDQIAFQAAQVEIAIESADDEYQVEVGGDHLLLLGLAGGAPGEDGPAREYGVDHCLTWADWLSGYPIADGGPLRAVGRAIEKCADGFSLHLTLRGVEPVLFA